VFKPTKPIGKSGPAPGPSQPHTIQCS